MATMTIPHGSPKWKVDRIDAIANALETRLGRNYKTVHVRKVGTADKGSLEVQTRTFFFVIMFTALAGISSYKIGKRSRQIKSIRRIFKQLMRIVRETV